MVQDDSIVRLSDRQRQVLQLLDSGAPIKVIADTLGISDTRVNQIIRTLKEALGVNDRFSLIQAYRELPGEDCPLPYRKTECLNHELPGFMFRGDEDAKPIDGDLVFSDAQAFQLQAPWEAHSEKSIVPGMLDGSYSTSRRLIVMVVMAAIIAAAIVLVLVAAMTVSEVLDGVAEVPQELT